MFNNKKVLITGGSSGLGLALAKRIAKQGAHLVLLARNEQKLIDAVDEVKAGAPNSEVHYYAGDVTDETATNAAIEHVANLLGGLDVLINSAGILREGYFETLPMSDFRQVMEINYFGQLQVIRAALPHLRKSKGRIVNVASMAGLTGAFGYTPYCSSKHALVGLSESLRYELKPQGIKLHLVCPAEFDSPMVDELDKDRTPENRAHTLMIPKTSVDVIVNGTLNGLKKDKFLIVPGTMTKIAAWGNRHLTGLFLRLADNTVAKVYQGPKR